MSSTRKAMQPLSRDWNFLFILHRSVDVKINYKLRVIVNETIVLNKLLDRYITKTSNNELILLQLNKDLPNFLAGTSSTNCVLNISELKFIGCFFESSNVFLKLSDKPEEITLTIHLRRRCQQKPSGCPHAKRPGNKAEGLPLGVVSSPSRGRPL